MLRIRRRYSGDYQITAGAFDADGTDSPITSGTVTVLDGAGTAIVTDGICSVVDGDLSYALDVDVADKLDTYEARWSAVISGQTVESRTPFELVGDHLFEVGDLRASDAAFANETKFPDATLRDERTAVEEIVEEAAWVAPFLRGHRETLRGVGRDKLVAGRFNIRELYSVTIDGAALSAEQVAAIYIDDCILTRSNGWGSRVTLHYAYGLTNVPQNLVRPAIAFAKERLVSKVVSERVSGETNDFGFLKYTQEGVDGATPLRSLNAAIDRISRKGAFVG